MFQILRREDLRKGAIASIEFEGKQYGAGVSFFVGHVAPGKGPGLHRHPYAETCIVLAGRVAMVADGKEVVVSGGEVAVIAAETPHRFTAIGDEPLDMVAIHASDHFVIEWIPTEAPKQTQ